MAWDVTSLIQLTSKTMAIFDFVCAGCRLLPAISKRILILNMPWTPVFCYSSKVSDPGCTEMKG